MRTRSQPEHQQAGILIAKRWNRLGPIDPILISTALAEGNCFAILAQAAATLTADDPLVEKSKRAGIRGNRARTGRRQAGVSSRRRGVCSGEGAHTKL